jgi:hypothetical protein
MGQNDSPKTGQSGCAQVAARGSPVIGNPGLRDSFKGTEGILFEEFLEAVHESWHCLSH